MSTKRGNPLINFCYRYLPAKGGCQIVMEDYAYHLRKDVKSLEKFLNHQTIRQCKLAYFQDLPKLAVWFDTYGAKFVIKMIAFFSQNLISSRYCTARGGLSKLVKTYCEKGGNALLEDVIHMDALIKTLLPYFPSTNFTLSKMAEFFDKHGAKSTIRTVICHWNRRASVINKRSANALISQYHRLVEEANERHFGVSVTANEMLDSAFGHSAVRAMV